MSEVETVDVRSEVYKLEDKSQTVGTAKSQFAEDYEIPYSNVKGKIVTRAGGYYMKYPAYCVVVEVNE